MSIQRDQNLVICPKEREQNLVICAKERPKLSHTKHKYKYLKIRLEYGHHKKINMENYKGQSRRLSRNDPPQSALRTILPVDTISS